MESIKLGVLIISPFFRPNIGGAETHLDDLCEFLSERGNDVYVITYQPLTTKLRGRRIEKKRNLTIYRINWFGQNLFHRLEKYPLLEFLYLTPGLLFFSLLFMIMNFKRIDVIHAHGFNAAFSAKILSKLFNKRSVVSTHAIYNLKNRPLFSKLVYWLLSSFNKILTLAEPSRKDIIDSGIPSEKVWIYTQWVNQSIFKPKNMEDCRENLKIDNRFTVLFVGRFIEKKGVLVLLDVAKKLPFINFVFIGDGPLSSEVTNKSRIHKNIIHPGKITNPILISIWYNTADLFVIPSQYSEGFARVVLESLSSGVPVIASNKGCLPEMINNSVGRLVKPTENNLKSQIEYFYKNKAELTKLRSNCRTFALKNYNEEKGYLIIKSYIV